MSSPYKFAYADVSVYANAVSLITRHLVAGDLHLDLGCGYAAIAAKLQEAGIRYIGFDADVGVVAELRANGVEAHTVDLLQPEAAVEMIMSVCDGARISGISLLDVVEHLDFECRLLTVLREALPDSDGVTLVVSVPNFSHTDVATKLFAGDWEYTTSGLLDNTHRVIYTEVHLGKTMQRNGWEEIARQDYRQEYSDQYFLRPSVVLNRHAGVGKHLRALKASLDGNADIHQFVRAYRARPAVAAAKPSSVLLSVLVSDDISLNRLHGILAAEEYRALDSQLQIILLGQATGTFADGLPDKLRELLPTLTVSEAGVGAGETFWQQIQGKYWAHFCLPLPGAGYFHAILPRLAEVTDATVLCVSPAAPQETADLLTAPRSALLLPSDHARQFGVFPDLAAGMATWQAYLLQTIRHAGVRHLATDASVIDTEALRFTPKPPLLVDPDELPDDEPLASAEALRKMSRRIAGQQQQIAALEAHVQGMQQSLSWRLTRPLRFAKRIPQLSRKWLAMNWLNADTWRLFFRAWVVRIPVLRVLRQQYLHRKFRLFAGQTALWNSSGNLPALQALSTRRFSQDALPGHAIILLDGQLPMLDMSVVAYNSAQWVEPFVKSLLAQDYPLKKIHLRVVDHGSQDDTVQQFERLLPSAALAGFELIRQENLGFGAGHDRAIRDGSAEYCLITNLDVEFLPDSLRRVVSMALADAQQAVASWELRQTPFEHPKYYDPVTLETNWSSHACILVRRSAYLEVGGYDPAIFMYAEDVELSYRFRSCGYALKYAPGAAVRHFSYEEAGQVKPLQFSGSTIGNLYIRLRYGGVRDRLVALPMYAALLLKPAPFVGAKSLMLKNLLKLLPRLPHFLTGKGTVDACFPFRRFDYELVREGAFHEVTAPLAVDDAPLVSVIIRTYRGRGGLLQQAIQSVFNQCYPRVELLVVEDGGDTQEHLVGAMSRQAPHGYELRFIACDKLGRSGTGNIALAAARGEYLMFLDDDDLLFADHVDTLVAVLRRDESLAAAYALAFEVLTEMADDCSDYRETAFYTPEIFRQEWNYEVLTDHNFIPIQAILFRRSLYEQRGGFDTTLDQLEDWNLWIRYGYGKRFAYVPKTTSLFRSPARFETRSARHALLHEAYETARVRAFGAIGAERGG